MVIGTDGAETKNDYAGEDHQQFTRLDWLWYRERERERVHLKVVKNIHKKQTQPLVREDVM
jgi:hypothetical protein